jgi:hypothetical protein
VERALRIVQIVVGVSNLVQGYRLTLAIACDSRDKEGLSRDSESALNLITLDMSRGEGDERVANET